MGFVLAPYPANKNRRVVYCWNRKHERILPIPMHSSDRLRKVTSYSLPSRRIRQGDRRTWYNISWRQFFLGGRRAALRREEDKRRFNLIDRYQSRLMLSIVLLLCLSVSDGFLTLYLIDNDMYELNPFMAYLLRWGPFAFITGKFLLTSFWSDLFGGRQQQLHVWFQGTCQKSNVCYDSAIFGSAPVEHLPGIHSLRRCSNGRRSRS